ncbi:glycoside hydrolase family 43 protein [Arenibacter sp. GZD96]|uniref:glycoside hydrolase family 43 protein n=1 Tax=Aurantibrevibacter litoralis TaxID=3106030 RepID=UPI002AFF9BD5|nr:glycoside hydrolase family 43 protein [Arenibacter sp. GZD-96]MEA1786044.1 glycoside hydrolase family 43 protein [Arenibacter sp. GZD-96]
MTIRCIPLLVLLLLSFGCKDIKKTTKEITSGNPIFHGWYADPEVVVFDNEYWIYPTFSAAFDKQVFMDAFSSKDLITWKKYPSIIDTTLIKWAKQALWAPSAIENDGKYYLFFSANDIQRPGRPSWDENNPINHFGGIGIAVADAPGGPFTDYLGTPLISDFYNDAQPIDQFVFKDDDGTFYMFYGGWGHCNIGVLNEDFTGFIPNSEGNLVTEITPEGYVEGPFVFKRLGTYYFMWSEGNWTDGSYKVAYAMSDNVTGPYTRIGTILQADPEVATGAGHNSVLHIPGTDQWYIVYHRRPIPNEDRDHRVTCIDKLEFNADGTLKDVVMTFEGVAPNALAR